MTQYDKTTRRTFLKASATLGLSVPVLLPSLIRAESPNEKVLLASVGVGGKGWTDSRAAGNFATMVAFADVNQSSSTRRGGFASATKNWPKAKGYQDWRVLLDKHGKEINAMTVTTPDHMHAPITMSAIQLGIGTYTQKPLTRTIHEARVVTEAAAKAKVATQMGNQHHSGLGYRYLHNFVQSGKLGKVKFAHTWSNRPIWPQGIDRPAGSDKIPEGFDWDMWLGVAKERPFKDNTYHPFKWRGWYDFGAGALGDMGCHIIDPVVWALELGPPKTVTYNGPKPNSETFPENEVLTYAFPGTKYTSGDTLKMTWSDGNRLPSIEGSALPADYKLPPNGVLIVGEKATLICPHGNIPRLYVDGEVQKFKYPSLPNLDHYGDWINAVKTGKKSSSDFSYSGPLTETVLVGVVASRAGNETLHWDSKNLKFTNNQLANQWIREDYRKGWEVKGLSQSKS